MVQGPPKIIAIEPDDYHAANVGQISDGRQFFLTTPFLPAIGGNEGREFVALYIFDAEGRFLEARIDDLGRRTDVDEGRASELMQERLRELGKIKLDRIEIQPFEVTRFDTVFGLVARPGDEPDAGWWVEAQPGSYMAFHEPWDSGEYDT